MKKVIIYTDGGSRGNPGKAASAVVVCDEFGNILEEFSAYIGIATNNVAEYTALIKGLELAKKYGKEVEVFSDSELVIRQVKGIYKIKVEKLQELNAIVKEKAKEFDSVEYKNVPRENNMISKADYLVNEELDRHR